MDKIEIAEGSIKQLEEIAAVNYEIFASMYQEEPFSLEHYKNKLKDKNPIIYIAKANNAIVGDSISFERDNSLHIWILGVKKEYRNQGIATKLFELNEQFAKASGYKSITTKVYNVSKEMLKLAISRGYFIQTVEASTASSKYNAIRLGLALN